MSPLSASGCAHDHEVAVEDAGVDHRLAADPQHEELAVAGEVFGHGHHLFDVLDGEHAGAGGDIADERDMAHRAALGRRAPVLGSRVTSIARGLLGSRRR